MEFVKFFFRANYTVITATLVLTLLTFPVIIFSEDAETCSDCGNCCGRVLRRISKSIEVDGYENCIEKRVSVICKGYCESKGTPTQYGNKIVYIPECKKCRGIFKAENGTTKRVSLLVPANIECNGQHVKSLQRAVYIPTACECQRQSLTVVS